MQCPDGAKITNSIIDFVMQEESGDVETLRKALYCQVNSIHLLLLFMWSNSFRIFYSCTHSQAHEKSWQFVIYFLYLST